MRAMTICSSSSARVLRPSASIRIFNGDECICILKLWLTGVLQCGPLTTTVAIVGGLSCQPASQTAARLPTVVSCLYPGTSSFCWTRQLHRLKRLLLSSKSMSSIVQVPCLVALWDALERVTTQRCYLNDIFAFVLVWGNGDGNRYCQFCQHSISGRYSRWRVVIVTTFINHSYNIVHA